MEAQMKSKVGERRERGAALIPSLLTLSTHSGAASCSSSSSQHPHPPFLTLYNCIIDSKRIRIPSTQAPFSDRVRK